MLGDQMAQRLQQTLDAVGCLNWATALKIALRIPNILNPNMACIWWLCLLKADMASLTPRQHEAAILNSGY